MSNDIAVLPPDPDKPGWWWVNIEGIPVAAAWMPSPGWWMQLKDGEHMTPDDAGAAGYTLATRHRIPTPGELEAVYALAARPTGPTASASPFKVGYVAGMGYLAEKLRDALGGGA